MGIRQLLKSLSRSSPDAFDPAGTGNLRARELSAEEYVSREQEKAGLEEGGARWNAFYLGQVNARLKISARKKKQRKAFARS